MNFYFNPNSTTTGSPSGLSTSTIADLGMMFPGWPSLRSFGTHQGNLILREDLPNVEEVGPVDKPSPAAVLLEDGVPDQEYLEVASKLGYKCAKAEITLFLRFLQKEEIPVYDYAHVMRYLEQMAKSKGKRHSVQSLRLQIPDNKPVTTNRAYEEVVPIEALKMVSRVKEGFDKAQDVSWEILCVDKDPDPFLCANYMGKSFVLLHWDEPGFKITK